MQRPWHRNRKPGRWQNRWQLTLHAVRACACDGTAQIADIIGALNYVALNAEFPAIISMGVGTPQISYPLQLAVNYTLLFITSA